MANIVPNTVGLIVGNTSGAYPDGVVVAWPQSLSAAGTTQANAGPVVSRYSIVANASGTSGVILPVPTAGQSFYIYPSAATNALLIYPPVGGTINNGTLNASYSAPARKPVEFRALDSLGNYAVLQGA